MAGYWLNNNIFDYLIGLMRNGDLTLHSVDVFSYSLFVADFLACAQFLLKLLIYGAIDIKGCI